MGADGRESKSGAGTALWAVAATFGTYFCVYGFRKPFTAGSYALENDASYKTVLVTAQVLGYMLSKFIGIKVVAEMPPRRRALAVLALVGLAHAALLLYGFVGPPYGYLLLFVNGLPLGMVFGLVIGFLEGRRITEALTGGLCISFILADGFTKMVGSELLKRGVSETWMPFAAGCLFVPPLLLGVWMLTRIPPPDAADVAERAERTPLTRAERNQFLLRYGVMLLPILIMFLVVTVLRSVRADFAPEIWKACGVAEPDSSVFFTTELIVASVVIVANGFVVLVRDNRRAYGIALATAAVGLLCIVAAFTLREALGGYAFMVLVGLGLYLPYVAVHTTILERLIAMTRDRGNLGFLMSMADAYGYLGYVAVMFGKRRYSADGDFLTFFAITSWVVVAVSAVCLAVSWWSITAPKPAPEA